MESALVRRVFSWGTIWSSQMCVEILTPSRSYYGHKLVLPLSAWSCDWGKGQDQSSQTLVIELLKTSDYLYISELSDRCERGIKVALPSSERFPLQF